MCQWLSIADQLQVTPVMGEMLAERIRVQFSLSAGGSGFGCRMCKENNRPGFFNFQRWSWYH